jgi:hypothetical protein
MSLNDRRLLPMLPYFFFGSLPIFTGTGAEKVTKRKAIFGQMLRHRYSRR